MQPSDTIVTKGIQGLYKKPYVPSMKKLYKRHHSHQDNNDVIPIFKRLLDIYV